eukprot:1160495-Pelagomonas_calceolata.AAC.2
MGGDGLLKVPGTLRCALTFVLSLSIQLKSSVALTVQGLSYRCFTRCHPCTDQGTFRRAMRLMDTLREARTIMQRGAPSGKTTVAVSSRAGQAVSRNTRAATSTANVVFDVAVMGR